MPSLGSGKGPLRFLTVKQAGISRITVFGGDAGLAARFGLAGPDA
jgi:hypothetical protein